MIRRADGMTVYSGSHVGSRGTLQSIRDNGANDFSESLPEEDRAWEQGVKAAMITREGSLNYIDMDSDQSVDLISLLWGSEYRRSECLEEPFGRK
jgi:hypothetical protein